METDERTEERLGRARGTEKPLPLLGTAAAAFLCGSS